MSLSINAADGTVGLPDGRTIEARLSQADFRGSPAFGEAREQDRGTRPWVHYQFSGGRHDDAEVLTSLCFYDDLLVHAEFTIDRYPPGPRDWSSYSLDVEADIKRGHDRLLTDLLGDPHAVLKQELGPLPDNRSTLASSLQWQYPWGTVLSFHDSKGGGTSFRVAYGNRRAEAEARYASGANG